MASESSGAPFISHLLCGIFQKPVPSMETCPQVWKGTPPRSGSTSISIVNGSWHTRNPATAGTAKTGPSMTSMWWFAASAPFFSMGKWRGMAEASRARLGLLPNRTLDLGARLASAPRRSFEILRAVPWKWNRLQAFTVCSHVE